MADFDVRVSGASGAARGAPDAASSRTAGRPQGVLLALISCLPVLGAVLLAPVLPRMQDHFAGTPGAEVLVPVALTVPALVVGVLAPFAGSLVDRFGRKRLLVGALVVYAVFGTAPLWLTGLVPIVISRAGVGITEAAIMTCCTTLIADYFTGPARDRWLGLQTLSAAVAATLFFALGGALGSVSWRVPTVLYASGLVFAVLAAKLLWQPRPVGDTPSGDTPAGGVPVGGTPAAVPPVPWRTLATPVLVTLVGGVVFYTPIVELAYVLDGIGVTSVGVIGAVTTLASAATATGAFVFGRVAGRGTGTLLPVAFGLAGAGLVVIGTGGGPATVTAGAVIACAGTGLLLPTLLTWAVAPLDFAQRGRGTGLWTASLFLGEFLCPLLVLAVKGVAGGLPTSVGLVGAVALLLAAGSAAGFRRTAARPASLPLSIPPGIPPTLPPGIPADKEGTS
ncbi:MFS transporter [Streptomyces sp. NPDC047000]|uniref:MFS transporter n=1 Tax=Streptomyces sp. NPDC047000 TaxID=3155474 RepID=UPI00340FBC47